jgi:T-complex protein 1 subunit gamma
MNQKRAHGTSTISRFSPYCTHHHCFLPSLVLTIIASFCIFYVDTKQQRQTGRPAQLANIQAAKAVASIIRTTLGPRSMLKMLLDPMGSIVLTNDGHCILREVDVSHPTAKSMIELSRAQDEEVGDGTTSVIVLAAEVLGQADPYLRQDNMHPTVLVRAYTKALAAAMDILEQEAITIDVTEDKEILKQLVGSTLSTKFSSRWNDLMVDMALAAVLTVAQPADNEAVVGRDGVRTMALKETEVDLKRYAKVEKIPGGEMEDCQVLAGVMFQKDPVHTSMRRRIENPRILLLDTPLEYKKGESQTNMEITDAEDWNTLLKLEEEYVANQCAEIIAAKPDIVITEKGVSDLAQHYLAKANITAFRRLRKTDNNRIARATGATIVSRTDEIQESDIGFGCGLYEMRKIGNDWFCYLTDCKEPKACTIVLRGGSKDVLNEIERNLQDAMQVVRNVVYNPKLVCGGGAIEMAVAVGLKREGQKIQGIEQGPFQAVGEAMEVIPRTLAQNCGVNVIRTVTQLRAKHAAAYEEAVKEGKPVGCTWGVNGVTGELVDMKEHGIYEPFSVKVQTIKTAIESACMILRVDDIVSGSKKR